MIRAVRRSPGTPAVAAFVIAFLGATACRILPATEPATWLLLGLIALAAGAVAERPSRVWIGLIGVLLAEVAVDLAAGDPGGPFWWLALAGRLVLVLVLWVAGCAVAPNGTGVSRRWRLATIGVLAGCLVGFGAYVGYAFARSADYLAQEGEGACWTPSSLGWTYEAINYSHADDDRLLARQPQPWACFKTVGDRQVADQGEPAGTEVVSSDGIHVAGWYVAAGNGNGPDGPTLVLVHGGKSNKSGMLKYALPLHADYNLVFIDLRNQGRSTGDASSGGVLEARDLRAMIDWVERTKHPSWLGMVGNSNGAATVLAEAADDPRPQAFVLDSMHASVITQLGNIAQSENGYPAWPSAWALVTGASWRLGVDITAADPVRTITLVGARPVLLLHGLLDTTDRPTDSLERNVEAAMAAGIDVEVHVCPTGGHGTVIDQCPQAWADWVTHFLARARGSAVVPSTTTDGVRPVAGLMWCPITLGDGGRADPGVRPTDLPAGLPAGQPGRAERLFAVSFPPSWGPMPPLYAIGPADGRCGVDSGTGLRWWIQDAGGRFVFVYEQPGGDLPTSEQSCRYIEAARRIWLASVSGSPLPGACQPLAGDVVRSIPSGIDGLHLALVAGLSPIDGEPELRLYSYGSSGGPAVGVFEARCPAGSASIAGCRASLSLLAARLGIGPEGLAQIAGAEGRSPTASAR